VIAPGLALGHGINRIGCLLAGCGFGRPTDVPWAIVFTDPQARFTPLNIPLHPVQLYDAGTQFVLCAALLLAARTRRFPGQMFWTYLLVYSMARCVIEFYRGDPRGMIVGIALPQLVFAVIVPVSIVMLLRLHRQHSSSVEAPPLSV
jgi:phosphatidylglycerol:prolipoprotein diacylglycerol transferase